MEKKRAAAYAAVDECFTTSATVVGIGSGSTVAYCVERIAWHVKERNAVSPVCIPTSYQSRDLIVQHGLRLGDLQQYPVIDITFDGADAINTRSNLTCIKGAGGCFLQEKMVATCSKIVVIVVDNTKVAENIRRVKIPIEVIPMASTLVGRYLREYDAQIRVASGKLGPMITDNGNFIFDISIDLNDNGVKDVLRAIRKMDNVPGVVATGIFVDLVDKVYVGKADGEVAHFTKESST